MKSQSFNQAFQQFQIKKKDMDLLHVNKRYRKKGLLNLHSRLVLWGMEFT
jgi:predicted glycosyltransferase involved in capsule biosynthesis